MNSPNESRVAMTSDLHTYDIRRDGHAISGGAEALSTVPRVEMTGGKLFNNDKDRMHVLALLLESVGIDAAIRLGSAKLWSDAVADLDRD